MPTVGPLIPRRRLGAELRRLREQAGLLLGDAATGLECSSSKISRLETGQGIPKGRDVRDLLALYGVDDPGTRDRLLRLADESRRRGWWHEHAADIPAGLETYVSLESEASRIDAFAGFAVYGLVQTDEYTREAMRGRYPGTTVESVVQLKAKRQKFAADREITIVLDEATLHRAVGSPAVMRTQLEHLLRMNESTRTTILVYPFSTGLNPGAQCSFTIFRFDEEIDRNVVDVEMGGGDRYLDQTAEVSAYTAIFADLVNSCPNRSDSSELIREIMLSAWPPPAR